MLPRLLELYAASAPFRAGVLYAHLAGLMVGGGCAIALNRLTLLAEPGDLRQLDQLANARRLVIWSLLFIAASGVVMLLPQWPAARESRWLWAKAGLLVLLVVNGLRLLRAEIAARAGRPGGWSRLRGASMISIILWLALVLVSVIRTTLR
jgi:hypothetical protein